MTDQVPHIFDDGSRFYWELERRRMISTLRMLDDAYGFQTFPLKKRRVAKVPAGIFHSTNKFYWELERRRMIALLKMLDEAYGFQTFP